MMEKIGLKMIYGKKSYIYKINLNKSFVFMRVDEDNDENSKRYVVIVNSIKFYEKWAGKAVVHCEIENQYEQEKYNDAIEGFTRGIIDPVPLAEFGYYGIIDFINGITRTKWLIRNGAICFPMECERDSAIKICQEIPHILYIQKVDNVCDLLQLK